MSDNYNKKDSLKKYEYSAPSITQSNQNKKSDNRPYYLRTWYILLMFAMWFFIIPPFIGLYLLDQRYKFDHKPQDKIIPSNEPESQQAHTNTTPPKICLTADNMPYNDAINVYFNTQHYSCPSKYSYSSYFSAAFESILNGIPVHKIELSDEKVLRQKEINNPIDGSKNITKASNRYTLGNFVAIDTETTGLKPGGNDIIEICAIKFENYIPVKKFHTYLKPRNPIPQSATVINHITDDMVQDAPTFSQIKRDLQNFIGMSLLVAHNSEFDMKFLHVSGLDLSSHVGKVYDTLYLSRLKLRDDSGDEFENYKLATICEEQNILCDNFHSADADALACGIVFVDIVKQVFDVKSVNELL